VATVRFDLLSIFPRLFDGPLGEGIVRRAAEAGLVDIRVHDLRDYTADRHRSVDDVPYGGGPGMVFKPEPVVGAVDAIVAEGGRPDVVILTSPQGRRFTQAEAVRLSGLRHVVVLCGRYEGIDERVHQVLDLEELSIGDYVLSGGELAALVMVDAVVRLLPGAVGDEQSVELDSFSRGLLDYPHYTRPAEFRGVRVPDVLLSGHHADIERWRKRQAVARTLDRRPDLLPHAELDDEEREILRALMAHKGEDDGRD
jgi:tRNA (guanine37-N1)-methyltransferase